MLTQTIKNWLRKMFAWWPWKQSTQIEYSHVANPSNKGTTQESVSRSTIDGVVPQAQPGIVPRLSTVEELPERVVQSDFQADSEFTSTSPVEMTKDFVPPTDGPSASVQTSPSPQQRLEFAQYLVRRGILNEGFEE